MQIKRSPLYRLMASSEGSKKKATELFIDADKGTATPAKWVEVSEWTYAENCDLRDLARKAALKAIGIDAPLGSILIVGDPVWSLQRDAETIEVSVRLPYLVSQPADGVIGHLGWVSEEVDKFLQPLYRSSVVEAALAVVKAAQSFHTNLTDTDDNKDGYGEEYSDVKELRQALEQFETMTAIS